MNKFIFLNYIYSLNNRIDDNNGLIHILIGPRQVGKTTPTLRIFAAL